jgi:phosphoesterase RecJ-like protein
MQQGTTSRVNGGLPDVVREIRSRQRFVITSHARPDGDAVGSALALARALRGIGKEADVVLHDGVPRIYRALPGAGEVRQTLPDGYSCDAVILLECDSLQRTRLQQLERYFLISIDHHLSGKSFANLNWIEPHAAATAELIFRLARELGAAVTPEIASCLYTALLTDTGSFMFQGTSEHTFDVARELVLAGADPVRAARAIYFAHSPAKLRLLGEALRNLRQDGNVAWVWVSSEQMSRSGAREEDCEGLVNYVLSIGEVEVAIFFREIESGRFRVSLRSKGGVNVARVAESFGGGGHECASGCAVGGPLDAAVEQVLRQIRSSSVQ